MRMVSTSRVTKRAIATLLSVAVVSGLFAAVAAAQSAARTGIVISEFRVRGPAGGNDEFFELRNTSDASVDISGYALQGCASTSGNPSNRAIVADDTTLNPGQSFLFTNNNNTGGYSGGVAGDQTYGTGITDFGPANQSGARIVDGGEVVDQVGGPGSPCREGTGIVTPTENVDASLERRVDGTQDTDDNSADFQQRTPSDPQNRETNPGTPGGGECEGETATIVGTEGDDVISGTPDRDVISGLGGDDEIRGLGGEDRICGDAGEDELFGEDTGSQKADDELFGGEGDDLLSGGQGEDQIEGQGGNDTVYAGNDDDSVIGGEGNDRLLGGKGADQIEGNDGDDRITGADGADRIVGGEGSDQLDGSSGNDQLNSADGEDGNDALNGGRGTDACTRDSGDPAKNCESDSPAPA